MQELSMNIMDIAQNSIRAKATTVDISVNEDTDKGLLTIVILDNGCGMTNEQIKKVCDPFYTTRNTRRVGLGVPFFKMAAEMTGGEFSIDSKPGVGTNVSATFVTSHIDMAPLGDISATIAQLMCLNENVDVIYTYTQDKEVFSVHTDEISRVLDGIPMNSPQVMSFLEGYINDNTTIIGKSKKSRKEGAPI